jgi:hypothetical protein
MNIQATVPNVGTSAGPAFCVLDGKPYLAWKGEGTDTAMYWTVASTLEPGSDGTYSWSAQTKIPGFATSQAPAIAAFKGKLYLAWKGADDDTLRLASFDGHSWSAETQLQAGSSNGPALVSYGGGLLMAWKGEQDTDVWYFTSADGVKWTTQGSIASVGGTSTAPGLAANGNDVYMVWKAEPGDNRLFWSKYSGGKWSAQQVVTSGTTNSPALTCDSNGVIWLAWQAVNGGSIWYSKLQDEATNDWSPQVERYGIATSEGPALIPGGGGDTGIVLAWKGASTWDIWYGTLILPVPTSLTFSVPRTNAGQGTAASMAIQAQVVLNQNGECTFSGEFWAEDSWPEASENWYVGVAISDGTHAYGFSTGGQTGPGDTSNWNMSVASPKVAQYWGALAAHNPHPGEPAQFHAGDTENFSSWVSGFFGGLPAALEVAAEDVWKVISKILGGGEEAGEAAGAPSGE